jgi:hypothetical protein
MPADRLVLARVPTDRIGDRASYEFLERVDEHGHPVCGSQAGEELDDATARRFV